MVVSIGLATGGNLQAYWSGNHVFFEYVECYWSAFFVMYITRNLCTESTAARESARTVMESFLCDPRCLESL